jgi:hypothetical protein
MAGGSKRTKFDARLGVPAPDRNMRGSFWWPDTPLDRSQRPVKRKKRKLTLDERIAAELEAEKASER